MCHGVGIPMINNQVQLAFGFFIFKNLYAYNFFKQLREWDKDKKKKKKKYIKKC